MRLTIHCPSCSRLLAEIPIYSPQVSCAACCKSYGVLHGKLSKRTSLPEAILHFTPRLPGAYRRHYTLEIMTPERDLKVLQFSTPGNRDQVPVRRGDLVSVLYTMQGYVMKRLIAITNHNTGQNYVLPSPVSSRSYVITLMGMAAIGLSYVSFVLGLSVLLVSATTVLGIALYLKATNVAQLTAPSLEDSEENLPMMSDQRLLIQKRRLQNRLEDLRLECKGSRSLIEQLKDLKRKMVDLDAALYGSRIGRADRVIEILEQQIGNNNRLMQEYSRTVKMIEIETETSWISDQLPDVEDFTQMILQRLEELRSIEEQNQTLRLQLEAYEEVNHHPIKPYPYS